jgi:hypothetical protein
MNTHLSSSSCVQCPPRFERWSGLLCQLNPSSNENCGTICTEGTHDEILSVCPDGFDVSNRRCVESCVTNALGQICGSGLAPITCADGLYAVGDTCTGSELQFDKIMENVRLLKFFMNIFYFLTIWCRNKNQVFHSKIINP